MNGRIIPLEVLNEANHGPVICYPICRKEEFVNRLWGMKQLNIDALEFIGGKNIGGMPILGKGSVGIIVIAYRKGEKAALKIRRIDSNRSSMHHEAEMLEKANKTGVGPNLLDVAQDFLLMEYVEGPLLLDWIRTLKGANAKRKLRRVLHLALEQAWKLDMAGLDHGELTNAPKHIIVRSNDRPCILDFEAASVFRHVSNVTSLCQYLIVGSVVAKVIQRKLEDTNIENIVNALRIYKKKRSRENFEIILRNCGCKLISD